jgi:hypothetical protein
VDKSSDGAVRLRRLVLEALRPHVFGVQPLAQRGETGEIGKNHRGLFALAPEHTGAAYLVRQLAGHAGRKWVVRRGQRRPATRRVGAGLMCEERIELRTQRGLRRLDDSVAEGVGRSPSWAAMAACRLAICWSSGGIDSRTPR